MFFRFDTVPALAATRLYGQRMQSRLHTACWLQCKKHPRRLRPGFGICGTIRHLRVTTAVHQANGFSRDTFLAAKRTKVFRRFGFDVDIARRHVEVLRDIGDHRRNMRRHFGCLRNDGRVDIDDFKLVRTQQLTHVAQQYPAVDIFKLRVVCRKNACRYRPVPRHRVMHHTRRATTRPHRNGRAVLFHREWSPHR